MKNGKKSHGQDNIYVLDFSHHSLQDVPPEIFDYERTLTELNLGSNRVSCNNKNIQSIHVFNIYYYFA